MNAYAVLGGLVFVVLALILPGTFGLYSFAQSITPVANIPVTFQSITGCTVKTCSSYATGSPASQTITTDASGNAAFTVTGFSWGSGTVNSCPSTGASSPGVVTGPAWRILIPPGTGDTVGDTLPTETDVYPFGQYYYIDAQCPGAPASQLVSNLPNTFAPIPIPIGVCTQYDSRDNCVSTLQITVVVSLAGSAAPPQTSTSTTTTGHSCPISGAAIGYYYYCVQGTSGIYEYVNGGYPTIPSAMSTVQGLYAGGPSKWVVYDGCGNVVASGTIGSSSNIVSPQPACSATVTTVTNTATVVKTTVVTQSGTTTTMTASTTITSSAPGPSLNLGIIIGLSIAGIGAIYPEGKKDASE